MSIELYYPSAKRNQGAASNEALRFVAMQVSRKLSAYRKRPYRWGANWDKYKVNGWGKIVNFIGDRKVEY